MLWKPGWRVADGFAVAPTGASRQGGGAAGGGRMQVAMDAAGLTGFLAREFGQVAMDFAQQSTRRREPRIRRWFDPGLQHTPFRRGRGPAPDSSPQGHSRIPHASCSDEVASMSQDLPPTFKVVTLWLLLGLVVVCSMKVASLR